MTAAMRMALYDHAKVPVITLIVDPVMFPNAPPRPRETLPTAKTRDADESEEGENYRCCINIHALALMMKIILGELGVNGALL